MIAFTPPMECLPVERLPEGDEWVFELKLDGFRAQAVVRQKLWPHQLSLIRIVLRNLVKEAMMPERMEKLKAGLSRHKRALTVLSAAIVLISFTLREEIAEYLKDRLAVFDSVDAQIAKNAEGSIPSEFLVNQKLTRVVTLPESLKKMPEEEWRERVREQPDLAKDKIDEQMGDVVAVERISPREKYYKEGVKRVLDHRRKPFEALVKIVHGPSLTPEAQNELREIDKQLSVVEHEADGLQDEAFKELLSRRKRLEMGALILKLWVYILFIFGWTLGLALSLIGETPEAQGE